MTTLPLPASLQVWHPWLSWFAPELAAQLGELLGCMHPLLGRFQGHRQGGVAEPEGLQDLHRRGSYERLLASEWLLASELPDEFLRRAATDEHLFLAPRPRARKADRLIVALFDAGPLQLGAPRLAQLALWILLARRAAEAGGQLRWGTLQRPGHWHVANTAEDLRRWLQDRCFDRASPEHGQAWSDWLAEHATAMGECWQVGWGDGHTVRQHAKKTTHTMQLRPGWSGETLDVTLHTGMTTRTMCLPLPKPWPAAQLLKGRFSNEAPAQAHKQHPERFSLRNAPIVSPDGALVAVPMLDGHGVTIFRIPVAMGRKLSKPKCQHWASDAVPLAAAFCGKTLGAVLSVSEQRLAFWQMTPLTGQLRPPREAFEAPPGRGTLLPCLWQRDGQRTALYVVDAAHRLVRWMSPHHKDGAQDPIDGPTLLYRNVLCLAPVDAQRMVYVCLENDRLGVHFKSQWVREDASFQLMAGLGFLPKVFLAGGARWREQFGGCAVRIAHAQAQETWRVYEPSATRGFATEGWECQLSSGVQAIGLIYEATSARYALVVQAANRMDLVLQFKDSMQTLYTTPQAIERVSVCPSSGLVAMLTRERALHVYSTLEKSIRLVVHSPNTDISRGHEPT